MSTIVKHSEERLMKVLLAPVISEKATFVAEKNEQVVFLVMPDATNPENRAAV
jgi:large subunit ribosomal protein L23